jgi:hypothetical protein
MAVEIIFCYLHMLKNNLYYKQDFMFVALWFQSCIKTFSVSWLCVPNYLAVLSSFIFNILEPSGNYIYHLL